MSAEDGVGLLNRTSLSPASPPSPQRQRQRRLEVESPGYAELPATPHPAAGRRRKRFSRWFRSLNVPATLRSPWAVILPLALILFIAAQLYLCRHDEVSPPAAAAVVPPNGSNFDRLRGGHRLFQQYDAKGSQIDAGKWALADHPTTTTTTTTTSTTRRVAAAAGLKNVIEAAAAAVGLSVAAEAEAAKAAPTAEVAPGAEAASPPPEKLAFSHDELYHLKWRFNVEEKALPYVGNAATLKRLFPREQLPSERSAADAKKLDKDFPYIGSRKQVSDLYYNALAVFPQADAAHPHGRLGVTAAGKPLHTPKAMPPSAAEFPGGVDAALKNGGFFLALSDALPLERDTLDSREQVCLDQKFLPAEKLGDVSIIITYYNEPFSTLMRSVHSVLNQTPPEFLREVILVDDHSVSGGCEGGSFVDEYVRYLPKVKLMHLGERRGIVTARLAGIKLATAPTVVVLDSHIELNPGWLEPQLQRLAESPKSLVFPQILSVDPETFAYRTESGIGTYLSFKWMMQERPFAPHAAENTTAVASPSMAGGLFAMRRDWFYEAGAFDEEFEMWGAENVEFALRVWQCGGRVEGIPCAKTYHIYRHKGVGYKSPSGSLLKNRLRTSRLWLDEYHQIAKQFIAKDADERDIGSFDKMLALKEKLKCKNFQWYLDNVAARKQPRSLDDVELLGDVRNVEFPRLCLDTLQGNERDPIGLYPCHGLGGSQAFMSFRNNPHLMLGGDETHCVSAELKQQSDCDRLDLATFKWRVDFDTHTLRLEQGELVQCLGVEKRDGKPELALGACEEEEGEASKRQQWTFSRFQREENFQPPEFSPRWRAYKKRREEWLGREA